MKKKMIIPMLVLSLALSSLVTGCSKEEAQTTATDENINISAVEVEEIKPGTIEKDLTYAGKIEADKVVGVTPKISGRVQEIMVDVGDTVKEGQILFTIDKSDLLDQIASLESQLKVVQANVASAEEGLRQAGDGGQVQTARLQLESAVNNASKSLESAKKGVENSKLVLNNAQTSYNDLVKKYNDYKQMYDAGVIAKNDFDSIELGYNQAKNGLEQAQIGVTTSQNQLEQAQIGYEQARKSLEIFDRYTTADNTASAQAGVDTTIANMNSVLTSLQQVRDKLPDTVVKAPCSGVVSSRMIEVTNMVSAGSNPIQITDSNTVTVSVNISETLINKVAVGDKVKVSVDSAQGGEREAVIKTITGVTDGTGTYPVKVEINNGDGSLKPGMFASVEFVSDKKDNTVVVERNTLLENETEKFVFVMSDDTHVKKVVVETGIDNGEYIEITSGVSIGDKVVVSGQDYLSDGETVHVVESGKGE